MKKKLQHEINVLAKATETVNMRILNCLAEKANMRKSVIFDRYPTVASKIKTLKEIDSGLADILAEQYNRTRHAQDTVQDVYCNIFGESYIGSGADVKAGRV